MTKHKETLPIIDGQVKLNIDKPNNNENELMESEFKKFAREGEDARENRESELIGQIIESTLNDLPETLKETFYKAFKTDLTGLKIYIKDFIKTACPGLNGVYYDDNKSLSSLLKEATNKLQNSIEIQKKRWYLATKDSIKNKDSFIQRSYDLIYKDTYGTFEEFLENAMFILDKWYNTNYASGDNNSLVHMVNYPFYKAFTNTSSIKSALKYDIRLVTLYAYGLAINSDFIIYRQLDVFTVFNIFKKSNRRKVVSKPKLDGENLVLSTSREAAFTIYEQNLDIKDLLEHPDLPQREKDFLLMASKNFGAYQESQNWIEVIKFFSTFLRDFDETDQELFSYILSQISQSFYVDRKISFSEKEALMALGKNHTSGKNKTWLRDRTQKLRYKSLKLLDSESNKVIDSCATLFQDVQLSVRVDNNSLRKYKIITVVASDELFKRILREDTINVYRNDFVSVKESSKPYATLLLYHLQLLRINYHIIGKTETKIPTSYFEDKIDIVNLDKIDAIEEIRSCLNIYKEKGIFIKYFNYDEKYDIWKLTFFPFKKHDANMLINSKKNYKSLLMDCAPQILLNPN